MNVPFAWTARWLCVGAGMLLWGLPQCPGEVPQFLSARSYAGEAEDRVRGLMWQSGTTNGLGVLVQTQGGYVLEGSVLPFSETPTVLIQSLDASNRVSWATWLRATAGIKGHALVPASEGAFALGGAFQGILEWQKAGANRQLSSFGIQSGCVGLLDKQGEIQWVQSMGGSEEGDVLALGHKPGWGLAATGYFVGQGMFPGFSLPGRTATQLFVCKLAETGKTEWVRDIGGGESAIGMGVDMDDQGTVFVGGQFVDVTALLTVPSGSPEDSAKLALERSRAGASPAAVVLPDGFVGAWAWDGKPTWHRIVHGPGIDRVTSIATRSNVVYAAGFLERGGGIGSLQIPPGVGGQWFLMAFDTGGRPLWEVHATGNQFSEAYSVAVDESGNAYVTGYFNGAPVIGSTQLNAAGTDTFIAKFNRHGTPLWAVQTRNTAIVVGTGLTVSADGSTVALGGYSRGSLSFGGTPFPSGVGRDGFVATFLAPPDAPRLEWTREADGLELRWRFPEVGLNLEYRTNLLGRTVWRRYDGAPQFDVQSGKFQQRVPFSSSGQAFRLRK